MGGSIKKIYVFAIVLLALFWLATSLERVSADSGHTWKIENVYTVGDVGKYSSIALDSNGNPHITCYDESNGNLRYFYWDGEWIGMTVDTADVGKYSSIAVDSDGNPHICYYDDTNNDLKYMYYSEGSWHTETVDSDGDVGRYCSIALNSTGNPVISYYDASHTSLKCARRIGGDWWTETVDLPSAANVGQYSSIAIDPNNNHIHISYYDSTNKNLKYAFWDEDWTIKTFDTPDHDDGKYTSIALDSNGNPHISCYDATSTSLRVWNCKDGAWFGEIPDWKGDVGKYTSIAVDSNDVLHISYYDSTNAHLKYAYRTVEGWNIENVDLADNVGTYTSIALDSSGYPHISYYDWSDGDLKYAKMNVPPVLSNPSVSPSSGPWGETFTYQVTYQDNDNDTPAFVRVVLDGKLKVMTKVGEGSYKDGVVYQYSWSTNSGDIGTHSYYFEANDGLETTKLPPGADMYSGPEVTQHPPVADFTYTPESPEVGEIIHFNDNSTDDDGTITGWSWDFNNDGVQDSSDQNPTHSYPTAGTYTVTLTVTDDDGATDTYSKDIHVGVANHPPILSSGSVTPNSGEVGTTFTYEVTYADHDGDAPTYITVYIDGSAHAMEQISGTYAGGMVYQYKWITGADDAGTHTYHFETSDGIYIARLPEVGEYDGPQITAVGEHTPMLSSGSVTPNSGVAGTTFTYQVTYQDNDNDAPTSVLVYIDGSAKEMTKVGDENYTEGVVYQYEWVTTSEDIGSHVYYFKTSDGTYRTRLPAVDNYDGPTVTAPTYKIYGYVESEGTPIEGATVNIDGQSTVTDSKGYYEITGVEGGKNYTVEINASGYETYSGIIAMGNENKSFDISLIKSAAKLDIIPILFTAIIVAFAVTGTIMWIRRKRPPVNKV